MKNIIFGVFILLSTFTFGCSKKQDNVSYKEEIERFNSNLKNLKSTTTNSLEKASKQTDKE